MVQIEKKPRASLISLGCAKNQVDSERMLGTLAANGYIIENDPAKSDVIIVNTCGFIEPAKEESIETILNAAAVVREKRPTALVVAGCLVERYQDELAKELSDDVQSFVPLDEEGKIVQRCDEALGIERAEVTEWEGRCLISPAHWAYLKISEGCDHTCSFCAIPGIRGKHRSVPVEALVEEATRLAEAGVKELNLVAQDTTLYGADIYGKKCLPTLLEKLNAIDGIRWIRLFYAHPVNISDDMMDAIADLERVVPYLDMPIQHVNTELLKIMRRKVDQERIVDLTMRLRERIPGITLRTSVIVGHPKETEARFDELLELLETLRFERLGVFTYSEEEGTRDAELADVIPKEVKEERSAAIMELHEEISADINQGLVGSRIEIMIEETSPKGYIARSAGQAPEVDGDIAVRSDAIHNPGDFVEVEIVEASGYDLTAQDLSQSSKPRETALPLLPMSL